MKGKVEVKAEKIKGANMKFKEKVKVVKIVKFGGR